jgi:hypothetical protein
MSVTNSKNEILYSRRIPNHPGRFGIGEHASAFTGNVQALAKTPIAAS